MDAEVGPMPTQHELRLETAQRIVDGTVSESLDRPRTMLQVAETLLEMGADDDTAALALRFLGSAWGACPSPLD